MQTTNVTTNYITYKESLGYNLTILLPFIGSIYCVNVILTVIFIFGYNLFSKSVSI